MKMNFGFNLLKKITLAEFATDYSTDGALYPPLFVWLNVKNRQDVERKIKEAIRASDRGISLYVHFPFCVSRCSFCRFFSLGCKDPLRYQQILSYLIKELKLWADLIRTQKNIKKIPLGSIYLGGGTPTLFDLEKFFGALKKDFEIKNCRQINLESSLDALNAEKLRLYKEIGINRLLIGIQSLDPSVLKKTRRYLEQSKILEKTYFLARKVGLPIVTFELICGLPGQSAESFFRDLRRIINLKPDGIHIYSFFLTPLSIVGRAFMQKKRRAQLISFRGEDIFRDGRKILQENGYINFGDEWVLPQSPGARNLQISRQETGSIISVGPSAIGTLKGKNYLLRIFNTLDIGDYQTCLDKGLLPISKYYSLYGDELKRAHMIVTFHHSKIKKMPDYPMFHKELNFFRKKGILKEDSNGCEIGFHNNLERQIYPKIFYSPKVLQRCQKIIKEKFPRLNAGEILKQSIPDVLSW